MSADEHEETGAAVEEDGYESENGCNEEIDEEGGKKKSGWRDILANESDSRVRRYFTKQQDENHREGEGNAESDDNQRDDGEQ